MHSRPRKDQVPRQQRRALTQERDHLLNPKDHIPRSTILHHLPIQFCPNLQFLRIRNDLRRRDARAKWCPAVETFAEPPLAATTPDLPFAVGDVVADSIAEDVV